jgi:site-specific DNA-methyltransferase (adenine-specific)
MLSKYLNKIILGDCLELLKKIPDNSVDLTFGDPPFNLKKKYNNYIDEKDLQDYLFWCERWIVEMVRITKPTGSIFIHNIPKWLTYFSNILNKHAYFKHWISWDALSKPRGNSLQPAHYGLLYYVKNIKKSKVYELRSPHKRERHTGFLLKDYGGKKQWIHPYGPFITDVWSDIHRIKHDRYRDDHPCQLPIQLLERIILLTTDKNDIVLDLFSGTGVTSIAAKRLGRKYIGFEIDSTYVKVARKKLSNTRIISKIDKMFVSIYRNEVITLRDNDWKSLKKYFSIPRNRKLIDKKKIFLKDKNILRKNQSEIEMNRPAIKKSVIKAPNKAVKLRIVA